MLAHGNRAIAFASKAIKGEVPVVAVAHNYHFQYLYMADAVFAINRHMAASIHKETGIPHEVIFHMPNMIRMESGGFVRRTWREPPVIGAMGRFVPKKGFDVLLRALANLRDSGYQFRLLLGGDGEERRSLQKLAKTLELEDRVSFIGWVRDKKQFFDDIDLFCLPSHHEPFGIVLLEAMAQKLPVIAADAEGPVEIIEHEKTGLLVPRGDEVSLAGALASLLADESHARDLAGEGLRTVKLHYEMGTLTAHMVELLRIVCSQQGHELYLQEPVEAAT